MLLRSIARSAGVHCPSTGSAALHTEARLASLGIEVPPPGGPKANYTTAQWQTGGPDSGGVLFLSGHLPQRPDQSIVTGRLGCNVGNSDTATLTLEEGQAAARLCGLNLLATMQSALDGNLDRVEQVVKLFGIVSSDDGFFEQHLVLNGASDFMIEVFGADRGMHARSAIGTSVLPLNIAVEVEAVIRVSAP